MQDLAANRDYLIERLHARIQLRGDQRYEVVDESPGGTFLNGKPIDKCALLKSGDLIQVGNAVLCFQEKRKAATA